MAKLLSIFSKKIGNSTLESDLRHFYFIHQNDSNTNGKKEAIETMKNGQSFRTFQVPSNAVYEQIKDHFSKAKRKLSFLDSQAHLFIDLKHELIQKEDVINEFNAVLKKLTDELINSSQKQFNLHGLIANFQPSLKRVVSVQTDDAYNIEGECRQVSPCKDSTWQNPLSPKNGYQSSNTVQKEQHANDYNNPSDSLRSYSNQGSSNQIPMNFNPIDAPQVIATSFPPPPPPMPQNFFSVANKSSSQPKAAPESQSKQNLETENSKKPLCFLDEIKQKGFKQQPNSSLSESQQQISTIQSQNSNVSQFVPPSPPASNSSNQSSTESGPPPPPPPPPPFFGNQSGPPPPPPPPPPFFCNQSCPTPTTTPPPIFL
ncbi:MAG: hypothetical protein ACK5PQ_02325 [Alphaproteobacteria bacterium]